MKFRKKPIEIEAITFDELVEIGKAQVKTLTNGMPWSFSYKGQPITHENDDCYLIPTLEGIMKFKRGDMLITGVHGEIYPCKLDIFEKTYCNSDSTQPLPVTVEELAKSIKEVCDYRTLSANPRNWNWDEFTVASYLLSRFDIRRKE